MEVEVPVVWAHESWHRLFALLRDVRDAAVNGRMNGLARGFDRLRRLPPARPGHAPGVVDYLLGLGTAWPLLLLLGILAAGGVLGLEVWRGVGIRWTAVAMLGINNAPSSPSITLLHARLESVEAARKVGLPNGAFVRVRGQTATAVSVTAQDPNAAILGANGLVALVMREEEQRIEDLQRRAQRHAASRWQAETEASTAVAAQAGARLDQQRREAEQAKAAAMERATAEVQILDQRIGVVGLQLEPVQKWLDARLPLAPRPAGSQDDPPDWQWRRMDAERQRLLGILRDLRGQRHETLWQAEHFPLPSATAGAALAARRPEELPLLEPMDLRLIDPAAEAHRLPSGLGIRVLAGLVGGMLLGVVLTSVRLWWRDAFATWEGGR